MSISPSLSPRQCPDRYAFRAGRNLPDKEFRYLRTVIVTAAVHRGFGRRLPCHQSPGPGHCDPLCEEAPLLPKLRGYFAEFLRESCLAPLDSLSLRLRWFPLTKPLPMSRRLILQQARGQSPELSSSSHCLGAYGFMFYFTPRWGFFSPFPHGTTSLSVTQEYLALQGGPC
ncbi:hypothetical protein VNO80_33594 [Phaseolus coccineus]|uniref:Uncharacterized protein n=1 Tax=Phaseolus coccineus TaxID=3886 RepID=A0AAN9L1Q9_PHACN